MLKWYCIDRNMLKEIEKRIYVTILKIIITYSSEVWAIKENIFKWLTGTETDVWRRAAVDRECKSNRQYNYKYYNRIYQRQTTGIV